MSYHRKTPREKKAAAVEMMKKFAPLTTICFMAECTQLGTTKLIKVDCPDIADYVFEEVFCPNCATILTKRIAQSEAIDLKEFELQERVQAKQLEIETQARQKQLEREEKYKELGQWA